MLLILLGAEIVTAQRPAAQTIPVNPLVGRIGLPVIPWRTSLDSVDSLLTPLGYSRVEVNNRIIFANLVRRVSVLGDSADVKYEISQERSLLRITVSWSPLPDATAGVARYNEIVSGFDSLTAKRQITSPSFPATGLPPSGSSYLTLWDFHGQSPTVWLRPDGVVELIFEPTSRELRFAEMRDQLESALKKPEIAYGVPLYDARFWADACSSRPPDFGGLIGADVTVEVDALGRVSSIAFPYSWSGDEAGGRDTTQLGRWLRTCPIVPAVTREGQRTASRLTIQIPDRRYTSW